MICGEEIIRFDFNAGNLGQENLKIGIAAVFDGHGGKEASELAVQLLSHYLQLHISFLSKKEMDLFEEMHNMAFPLETEFNSLETHFRRLMLINLGQETRKLYFLLGFYIIVLTYLHLGFPIFFIKNLSFIFVLKNSYMNLIFFIWAYWP